MSTIPEATAYIAGVFYKALEVATYPIFWGFNRTVSIISSVVRKVFRTSGQESSTVASTPLSKRSVVNPVSTDKYQDVLKHLNSARERVRDISVLQEGGLSSLQVRLVGETKQILENLHELIELFEGDNWLSKTEIIQSSIEKINCLLNGIVLIEEGAEPEVNLDQLDTLEELIDESKDSVSKAEKILTEIIDPYSSALGYLRSAKERMEGMHVYLTEQVTLPREHYGLLGRVGRSVAGLNRLLNYFESENWQDSAETAQSYLNDLLEGLTTTMNMLNENADFQLIMEQHGKSRKLREINDCMINARQLLNKLKLNHNIL